MAPQTRPATPPAVRETAVTVAGVSRVIRTEQGARTAKQLEAAHTAAVRAALIEMRAAAVPAYKEALRTAEATAARTLHWADEERAGRARRVLRDAESGRLHSYNGAYSKLRRPNRVRYTTAVPAGFVQAEDGTYVQDVLY
jgi:hypothetical protein